MKKIGNYFKSVFGTYGLLTPLVVVALVYVVLITMERNDTFSALYRASKGWFASVAVIFGLIFAAAIVLTIILALSKNVNVLDLFIVIVFILSILLFVLFAFNPGNGNLISILKWIGASLVLIASSLLGILRANRIK